MFMTGRVLRTIKAESRHQFLLLKSTQVRYKTGFAAAMAEALEKFEAEETERKAKRVVEEDMVKESKRLKRDMKRRKWVDWKKQDDMNDPVAAARRAAFDPADRVKRKKTALLLGYSGANYFGMQRNPGMATIEEELFKAMLKHKWIISEAFEQIQMVQFQRAARTDKGVSAARQVCSMKLADGLDVKALNADLPEQIRLFGLVRVTKGFNCKDQCNARTYTYTMPTVALAPYTETCDFQSYRADEALLKKLKDTLQLYEGTENFHNFTSKKNFHDPSAKRFIMSFTNGEPFLSPQSVEFITLKVKGQSFMLHQIRKMVGLAIAIVRGNTTSAILERVFSEERIDIPTAPGLGLVLDTVHYERYNERYGKDGIHEPLTWEKQETQVKEFAEKYIYSNIYETEYKERSMIDWLDTLSMHTYEPRIEEETNEENDSTKNGDKDNKE